MKAWASRQRQQQQRRIVRRLDEECMEGQVGGRVVRNEVKRGKVAGGFVCHAKKDKAVKYTRQHPLRGKR